MGTFGILSFTHTHIYIYIYFVENKDLVFRFLISLLLMNELLQSFYWFSLSTNSFNHY